MEGQGHWPSSQSSAAVAHTEGASMSKGARTALVFGIYLVVLEPALIMPHEVLADGLRLSNQGRNLDSRAGRGAHHPGILLSTGCLS